MFASEAKKSAFGLLAIVCLINSCSAQLTYHADANTNSFSLKTPGLQQSFTRFYGGAQQQPQQQQQLQQQQAAQPVQVSCWQKYKLFTKSAILMNATQKGY